MTLLLSIEAIGKNGNVSFLRLRLRVVVDIRAGRKKIKNEQWRVFAYVEYFE